MVGADAAFAALINRAAAAYTAAPPAYMTFRETTHVEGADHTKDINRYVAVRVADDFAVMQDLPQGATREGPAFPVIPFFDPFSAFSFSYFANLARTDITFTPGAPWEMSAPPDAASADVVVPYFSFLAPTYAPNSTDTALHVLCAPTPLYKADAMYPSDVVEDPLSQLPAHVTLQQNGEDMEIGLDFAVVQGHWVVTRGTFSATQHVPILGSFKVQAVTTFSDFTFPATAPDPRLAGTPRPSPTPGA